MSFKDKIDQQKLPEHVAIIMDGNGRKKKKKGKLRIYGHRSGVKSVRETAEAAAELGIKFLTLYAFSTENWRRPRAEVNALMKLLVQTIHKETKTLHDNNIKLLAVGNLEALPDVTAKELREAIEETKHHDRMSLILALSYSSRWEITRAIQKVAKMAVENQIDPAQIDQDFVGKQLAFGNIPDPELLIRTSGEYRISNFMLWQIAYSELYFTPKLWPDFRREDLYEAIVDFQQRERRFGKTHEQLTK